jgi:CRISPR/Cas system CSM-associated protein Csm3 (group 7 of RAMP superfamily)
MATKKINYSISFLSEWHAGAGLSSGAEADSVVIKDKNNLPYLPGKTIKGLLKDALMDIQDVQPNSDVLSQINILFGNENKDKSTNSGILFFSNAELPEIQKNEISVEMSDYLYRIQAATKLNENGVAENGSLRTMEVTIPLDLEGYISSEEELTEQQIELLQKAMQWTRSIGVNRNRGLGRCQIQIQK